MAKRTIKKGEKILRFIKKAGKKGRRFTEIQKFIYNINYPDLEFNSRSTNRGYYCSALCGTYDQKGLLEYCIKNDKGRWTCREIPNSAVYSKRFSTRILD
jgi:hypothetical protein